MTHGFGSVIQLGITWMEYLHTVAARFLGGIAGSIGTPQHFVTGHVAATVVDHLELIEIEIAQHVVTPTLACQFDHFLQAVFKLA
jgi:hypothetical protein